MADHTETIIQAIIIALQGITEDNGYAITIQSVQRYDRLRLTTNEKPCIHVSWNGNNRHQVGAGWDTLLTVHLDVYLQEYFEDTRSTDEILELYKWAVETGLTSMNWGGLAADLQDMNSTYFAITDPAGATEDGVEFDLTIYYRLELFELAIASPI